METKKFVTGAFVTRRDNSPDFIKANISFSEKFIDYLKENFNSRGYVNLDLKESKEGKLYLDLNDWQPSGDKEQLIKDNGQVKVVNREEIGNDDIDISNIPF